MSGFDDHAAVDYSPGVVGRPATQVGKPTSKLDLGGHDLPPSPAPSSPRTGKRYAFATELVYTEGGDQYNASSTPIYQVYTLKQYAVFEYQD